MGMRGQSVHQGSRLSGYFCSRPNCYGLIFPTATELQLHAGLQTEPLQSRSVSFVSWSRCYLAHVSGRYYGSSPSDTCLGFRLLYKIGSSIVFATKDSTPIVLLGPKDGAGSLRKHPV